MSKSFSVGSGIGKFSLTKGLPISVRARAVWDAIARIVNDWLVGFERDDFQSQDGLILQRLWCESGKTKRIMEVQSVLYM
jgi:hypothetical protein